MVAPVLVEPPPPPDKRHPIINRKKGGRKPSTRTQRGTTTSVRLTNEVYDAVRGFCDAADWSLSNYLQTLVEADMKARGEL